MKVSLRSVTLSAFSLLAPLSVGCGDDSEGVFGGGGQGAGSTSVTSSGGQGGSASTTTGSGGASTTTTSSGAGGEGGGSTSGLDPEQVGPYTVAQLTGTATVSSTNASFSVRAYYPSGGPSAGPYPLVAIARGFQLAGSFYYGYAEHLASHGYVAIVPEYPQSFTGFSHVTAATNVIGSIDWALDHATLGPLSDEDAIGTAGHSLGGKLAFLTASRDSRIKAAIGLDPVDAAPFGCNATNCPDVSAAMPSIPMAVLGETLDTTPVLFPPACAPTADNYVTFYNGASSPSLEVTVLGADHNSFLDTKQGCGVCSACQTGTASNADVSSLSRAFVTAFFERRLRGIAGYDAWLDGAEAQARFVATNRATIRSK